MHLDPKSIMLIYTNIGLDLEMIQKTIEKLSFRSFKENIITVDEIEKYVDLVKSIMF